SRPLRRGAGVQPLRPPARDRAGGPHRPARARADPAGRHPARAFRLALIRVASDGVGEGVAIGVDLGGTTLAGGLVDAGGEVLAHLQEPTHGRGPGTALAALLDLLGKLEGVARARGLQIAGAGIGVPGTVDAERGVIGADIHYVPDLAGTPLAAVVGGRLGQPVFVDNDVNVLALGEWMFGAGRGARSLVVLALGTGVGWGIVLARRLHRGLGGFGGELGDVPFYYDVRPCICGARVGLKTY